MTKSTAKNPGNTLLDNVTDLLFHKKKEKEIADAEVVTAEAVPAENLPQTIPENLPAANPQAVKALLKNQEDVRALVLDYIGRNLVDGTDFGPGYPGSDKKSLLKPGSEKINNLLNIRLTFEEDEQTYKMVVAAGKHAICYLCKGYRGEKMVGEGRGAVEIGPQANEKKWGINQCIKMAEKRAQVDFTLRFAGISDLFTQDGEDDPKNPNAYQNQNKNKTQKPAAKQGDGKSWENETLKQNKYGEQKRKALWAVVNTLVKTLDLHPEKDEINNFLHSFFQVESLNDLTVKRTETFLEKFSLTVYDKTKKTSTDKDEDTVFKILGYFDTQWNKFKNPPTNKREPGED